MKKFDLMLIGVFAAIVFVGCSKYAEFNQEQQSQFNNFSIKEAKDWVTSFSELYQTSSTNRTFLLNWEEATLTEDVDNFIIDLPLQMSHVVRFDIRQNEESAVSPSPSNQNISKYILFKDKRTGNISETILSVQTKKGKFHGYNNWEKSFSGDIFLTDVHDKVIQGWRIINGIKTNIFRPRSESASRIKEDCEELTIHTYERTCYYFEDPTLNYCSEWMFAGSITVTSCPGETGGGGSNPNSQEVQNALQSWKADYEMSQASLMDQISLQSQSAVQRTKSYKWTCAQGLLVSTKSLEYGVHEKINNEWRWKSLTHQYITLEGSVLGGSIEILNEASQVQMGIYNAGVHLDFTIQYSALIPNVSPINWTKSYNPTMYFNVND